MLAIVEKRPKPTQRSDDFDDVYAKAKEAQQILMNDIASEWVVDPDPKLSFLKHPAPGAAKHAWVEFADSPGVKGEKRAREVVARPPQRVLERRLAVAPERAQRVRRRRVRRRARLAELRHGRVELPHERARARARGARVAGGAVDAEHLGARLDAARRVDLAREPVKELREKRRASESPTSTPSPPLLTVLCST